MTSGYYDACVRAVEELNKLLENTVENESI